MSKDEIRTLRVVVEIPSNVADELLKSTKSNNLKETIEKILISQLGKKHQIISDEKLFELVSTAVYTSMRGLISEAVKRVKDELLSGELTDELVNRLKNNDKNIRNVEKKILELESTINEISNSVKGLSLRIKSLEEAEEKRNNRIKDFRKDIRATIKKMKEEIGETVRDIESYKRATLNFQKMLESFKERLNVLNGDVGLLYENFSLIKRELQYVKSKVEYTCCGLHKRGIF
jgi:chromosome segregation ATPase